MKEPPLSRQQQNFLKWFNGIKELRKKDMKDLLNSLIRTYVPIIVGAFAAWLLTLGVELNAESQAGLIVAITGMLQALYYGLVRLIEKKYPKFGLLLGKAVKPSYEDNKNGN